MPTVYDVPVNALIDKAAEEMKSQKLVSPPDWAQFVKTGTHKQRPPANPDWWYVRSAAVLRKLYVLRGPIGVAKLRHYYGGKKNNGVAPEHHAAGSGSVARKVLQQLEAAKLVEAKKDGTRKGRIITAKGVSFLDKLSGQILKN